MKGLNEEERLILYNKLIFEKTYTSLDISLKAYKLFENKCLKVLRTHLGSNMVADNLLERPARNTYIKALKLEENPPNPPQNSQDSPEFIEVQPPYVLLHVATNRQLANELRRRGFEVEVSVMEKKKLDI